MRKIFGKNVEIRCEENVLLPHIEEEFSIYPRVSDESADFIVEIKSKNSIHKIVENINQDDAIRFENKTGTAFFILNENELKHIYFYLKKPLNKVHGWIQRFRHMGYNNRIDRIGLILHENILVPSVLFNDNLVPIHSSAVKYEDQVILFGGQGGVGKTSLELEFCFYNGGYFIADDFSVVTIDGMIHPNLSYPKLYGYNVEGQPKVKKVVLKGADFVNKLHWYFHHKKGANKVRRRISPALLYKNFLNSEVKINRYLYLEKGDYREIKSEKFEAEKAALISVEVLKNELSDYFKQLENQKATHIATEEILNRWEYNLIRIFKNINCEKICVPRDLSHEEFKKSVVEYLSQSGN